MARSYEIWKQRKLERMRLGQAVYEMTHIMSDPEIRMALIPLTDAELQNSLERAAQVEIEDNLAGRELRVRVQKNAVILASAREPDNLNARFFESYEEVASLDGEDVNFIHDAYMEMVENSSPSLEGISEADFEQLKKALLEIPWSELTGRQWYAAKRFLSTLGPQLLQARFSGLFSTKASTTTSEEAASAPNV